MTARDKFSQAVNYNSLPGRRRNRRWKSTLVFMLCASSCCRAATEEEQAQSKKGLKKQQKEAEKAAKKAEKQAKLVSARLREWVRACPYIRRPLFQLLGVNALLCGHCESRRDVEPQEGQECPLFKYSCNFWLCLCLLPNKVLFFSLFSHFHIRCTPCFAGAWAACLCQSPLIWLDWHGDKGQV